MRISGGLTTDAVAGRQVLGGDTCSLRAFLAKLLLRSVDLVVDLAPAPGGFVIRPVGASACWPIGRTAPRSTEPSHVPGWPRSTFGFAPGLASAVRAVLLFRDSSPTLRRKCPGGFGRFGLAGELLDEVIEHALGLQLALQLQTLMVLHQRCRTNGAAIAASRRCRHWARTLAASAGLLRSQQRRKPTRPAGRDGRILQLI